MPTCCPNSRLVLAALLLVVTPVAAAESAGSLSLQEAWSAWRAGDVITAGEASRQLLTEEPRDPSVRHLAFLTAFVAGEYTESLDHFAALAPESELRSELLGLALDALEHLGRLTDAAVLAQAEGASAERVGWLEARAQRPLEVQLASTSVVPFSADNFLSELMPAVPLEIDGMKLMGHLDTGGTYIAMSPRMAASLGITTQPLATGFANNQETTISMGLASEVTLGQASLRNVPVAALDALTGVAQGQDIEDMVILGTNLLSKFLVTWDNGERRLVLSPRDDGELATAHYDAHVPATAVSVPYYLYSDHYMFANGRLGDNDAVFFLDTGLVTVDSRGRQPAIGAARPALEAFGLVPDDPTERSIKSPSIGLGELQQEGHSIFLLDDRVAFDWHGLKITGLLTHGFTKHYSWTLDPSRRVWAFAETSSESKTEPEAATDPSAPAHAVSAQELGAWTGQYAVAPGVALSISADGESLYLQAPGQQKVLLEPVEPDVFAIPLAKAKVTFFRDAAGQATHLVLDQSGFETRAERLP